ncbi:MAG: hypothetical protein ACOY44_03765 [Pseudomonadota bacterium]
MHSKKVLRAWEFVALSIGAEVASIERSGTERYDASRIADPRARAEFDRRLDDLTHALNAGEVAVQQQYVYGPASWKVLAGDAAEFGRRQCWKMPQGLQALGPPSAQGVTTIEPAQQIAPVATQGTLAEQWTSAKRDMPRKHALAEQTVRQCQDNKAEAARRLGLGEATGPLYRALNWKPRQSSGSNVAGMYDQLTVRSRKT